MLFLARPIVQADRCYDRKRKPVSLCSVCGKAWDDFLADWPSCPASETVWTIPRPAQRKRGAPKERRKVVKKGTLAAQTLEIRLTKYNLSPDGYVRKKRFRLGF